MNTLQSYSYTILRYIHDTTTGEFVNVGVALYAPQNRYAGALCRNTYGRLSKMFPGMNAEHFKSMMRHIQERFEKQGELLSKELPLEPPNSVLDLARRILPADDSSLQWSPIGVGRTVDPSLVLENLFERMVMRYEDRPATRATRTDDDVWRHFKRHLASHQMLHYFEPKKITVQDDEIEFQYTWKNGVLHCIEPVSFDLSSSDSIRDKAHRWLGWVTSVSSSPEPFCLYFLVGQPQDESLMPAYENALSILNKVPVKTVILHEQQADKLPDMFSQYMADHQTQGE